MTKGWKNESERHKLASKHIKTVNGMEHRQSKNGETIYWDTNPYVIHPEYENMSVDEIFDETHVCKS